MNEYRLLREDGTDGSRNRCTAATVTVNTHTRDPRQASHL